MEDELFRMVEALAADYDLRVGAYTGRGMYGKVCLSVSGNEDGFWAFTLALGGELATRDNGMDMADLFHTPARDQMGHDMVWYWPGIAVEEGDLDG